MAWGEVVPACGELALMARSALLPGVLVGIDQVIFPSFSVIPY